MHMVVGSPFLELVMVDDATHLLDFKIVQTSVEMMSEAMFYSMFI